MLYLQELLQLICVPVSEVEETVSGVMSMQAIVLASRYFTTSLQQIITKSRHACWGDGKKYNVLSEVWKKMWLPVQHSLSVSFTVFD